MANPTYNERLQSSSSSARDIPSSLRDASERFTREAKNMIPEEVQESATRLYDQASSWLQTNQGKTIGVIAAITVAGMVGYMLGRNSSASPSSSMYQ